MSDLEPFSNPAPVRSTDKDTSEKLIAAAERLFAEHGYAGVSVRMIATAAGVNWSLLGYYFRGKEGLLSEVYRRHCGDLNSARMRLLQESRRDGRQPELTEVLNAFVRPALTVARGEKGQTSFIRLRAILAAENSALLDQLVAENFDLSSSTFINALRECLPHLTHDEILWRFHFMLGTIYYTASGPHRIREFSNGRCDPADIEENLRHLIPCLAAAFRTPPVKNRGGGESSSAKASKDQSSSVTPRESSPRKVRSKRRRNSPKSARSAEPKP